MEFVCLILFLVMYFFRPQEWVEALGTMHPVQLITFFAVFSLFKRDKGIKLSDLFQTPHDWLVFGYLSWTVFGSNSPWQTFKAIQSVLIIYIVGVQALSNVTRIKGFLGWWALSLMVVAGLALASEFGFDPFGTYELTHGALKGRLMLNLSIFNNPNGLGHTLVPVIPMVYFLFFWKKIIGKLTLALLALPLWCIFLTSSKGAFVCAFVTICSTLAFGRPKAIQLAILGFAFVFGTAALYSLPRMGELEATKGNAAIGGRVAAFRYGYECMKSKTYGIGLGNFVQSFYDHGPLEKVHFKKSMGGKIRWAWGYQHYRKATHSAFNQNGAELGYGGLMLFVAILYACLRTLITATQTNEEEERVRRALFSIVISYIVSCWMVDFAFRPTFFLFVAATGALHRILRANSPDVRLAAAEMEIPEAIPVWLQRMKPAVSIAALDSPVPISPVPISPVPISPVPISPVPISPVTVVEPASRHPRVELLSPITLDPEESGIINWRRLGLIDLLLIIALTQVVIWVWLYSIKSF